MEKPSNEQREEERREFNQLFGTLSDDDSEFELDFVPKKVCFKRFVFNQN